MVRRRRYSGLPRHSVSRVSISIKGGVTAHRVGKVAFLIWSTNDKLTANSFTDIATLPVGWRPAQRIYFPVENYTHAARGYIDTDGRFAVYAFDSANQTQGMVSFPLP